MKINNKKLQDANLAQSLNQTNSNKDSFINSSLKKINLWFNKWTKNRISNKKLAANLMEKTYKGQNTNFQIPDKQILTVRNLNIAFALKGKQYVNIIRGVDLDIAEGSIVGLVGESGSGKTVTSKALLGVNHNALTTVDYAVIDGIDLTSFKSAKDWLKIRGHKISYIPQDHLLL